MAPALMGGQSTRRSIRAQYREKEIGAGAAGGAQAGQDAPRRILSRRPPKDKEHQLASRKCRRESTT
jgi:hypothetical protein